MSLPSDQHCLVALPRGFHWFAFDTSSGELFKHSITKHQNALAFPAIPGSNQLTATTSLAASNQVSGHKRLRDPKLGKLPRGIQRLVFDASSDELFEHSTIEHPNAQVLPATPWSERLTAAISLAASNQASGPKRLRDPKLGKLPRGIPEILRFSGLRPQKLT